MLPAGTVLAAAVVSESGTQVTAVACRYGHTVPDGTRFCPQCGSCMQQSVLGTFDSGCKVAIGQVRRPDGSLAASVGVWRYSPSSYGACTSVESEEIAWPPDPEELAALAGVPVEEATRLIAWLVPSR